MAVAVDFDPRRGIRVAFWLIARDSRSGCTAAMARDSRSDFELKRRVALRTKLGIRVAIVLKPLQNSWSVLRNAVRGYE